MQKIMKETTKKGFTLIELLAVLVILAALSTIAIPIFANKSDQAKATVHKQNIGILQMQGNTYIMAMATLPDEDKELINELEANGYIREIPTNPITGKKDYSVMYRADKKRIEIVTKEGSGGTGDGEGEPVYEPDEPGYISIRTIEDLYNIRNNLTGSYKLRNNLDFNQDSSYANPTATTVGDVNGDGTIEGIKREMTTSKGWMPIGDYDTVMFTGILDGNGYKISNLYINRLEVSQSLMGDVGTGTNIKNIKLENVNITGDIDVGGLVSYMEFGTISNCYVTGNVTGEGDVGGLIGDSGSSTINSCYAIVNVTGRAFAGGLVGYNYEGSVNNSYATGSVTGYDFAGGLTGYNCEGSVNNSYATGSVTGYDFAGGLTGYNYDGTISNSYAIGSVSGEWGVGGLVGVNEEGIIDNCYAKGNVTALDKIGGLVGFNDKGTIINSYATGGVTGDWTVGGLVGYIYYGTISNSYATGSVTGIDEVGGVVGYNDNATITTCYKLNTQKVNGVVGGGSAFGEIATTITNLQSSSLLSGTLGWNMTTIWQVVTGGYPVLR